MKDNTFFESNLRALHDVGNELLLASSVRELCRRAVELGRERLGFDRISTWFVDRDPKYIVGSFGVDEKGRVRDEAGERVAIASDPAMKEMLAGKVRSVLCHDVPLRDNNGKTVGRGSHIVTAIWNGREIVGYLYTDNLLKRTPLTERDRELVELFSSTLGHLYSLKLTEDKLKHAYERIKDVHEQLVQAAKMEVIGGLASGVAHEVKNPLAVILQGVDYLSRKVKDKDEETSAALLRMRIAVRKANDIIKGLLDFSATTKLEMAPQNIDKVIEGALLLVSHEMTKCRIDIVKDLRKDMPEITIDKNKIEQVLINIFLNAANAMPKGGRLEIRTCLSQDTKKKLLFVEIEDTGPGIELTVLGKVFDPFYTTRRGIGGTGLGLTIVKNMMDMHKGKVIIENRKDVRGVKATLVFKV